MDENIILQGGNLGPNLPDIGKKPATSCNSKQRTNKSHYLQFAKRHIVILREPNEREFTNLTMDPLGRLS